ncbi:MAG: RluA family pseudouridine synthase [Spirochaetia bacterium]|jgi:tRNA pseudouridine32 synthase/23S rRNA pseudouridine746 synthase|nr:RluA family pseudouridine synthase [Spirochaetia bacterium]
MSSSKNRRDLTIYDPDYDDTPAYGSLLPWSEAAHKLNDFFDDMERTGFIASGISTESLFSQKGRMFGILIAKSQTGAIHILKAFSGCMDGRSIVEGFAPPLYDAVAFDAINTNHAKAIKEMNKEEGQALSAVTLKKLQDLYIFPCIDGGQLNFSQLGLEHPPTGTGDCCAPKLLAQAFREGLTPVSLVEGFFGKESEGKKHRHLYPPCKEKCALILPAMLGLDILYCDDFLTVLNKPAGLQTLPGKQVEDNLNSRLLRLFPSSLPVSAVHRLDMDTSGIVLMARNRQCFSILSRQFQQKKINKVYEAMVRGVVRKESGKITLPLCADKDHRPLQLVDLDQGKPAMTVFKRLSVERQPDGQLWTRLQLIPATGRTHQLRVHCKEMLFPIVADRLYGYRSDTEPRMLLHASKISFTHPVNHRKVTIDCPAPF